LTSETTNVVDIRADIRRAELREAPAFQALCAAGVTPHDIVLQVWRREKVGWSGRIANGVDQFYAAIDKGEACWVFLVPNTWKHEDRYVVLDEVCDALHDTQDQ
jgi:hypothetical protein